jgi:1-acyl-sn-glycerol-3-phosphate acyltransferase
MSRLRPALDRFVGAVCRAVLAIFFRRVEVVGRDRLPASGPMLVVANHVNGLIDPLFVLGPLRVPARMLGKSTLWRIPGLAPLLDLAGVIPVHRPSDPGVDPARNAETFARCHEELAGGGAIALFPEGTSHDDPKLKPLKTGAARIALEAERRLGPLATRIVPVGLVFEQRERFRSRALVVVGEPFEAAAPGAAGAEVDAPEAVRALTARIAAALERVTLNYDSWEEARLVELGADVWDRDAGEDRRPRRLASEFLVRRALDQGLERLRLSHPDEVRRAIDAARDYERLLRTAGLGDEQVAARYGPRAAASFALRTVLRLAIASPVAALGTLLNFAPWLAVHAIARRWRHEPNQVATYKVFPSLVVYPAAWTLETAAAARGLGGAAALATAAAAPLAGWVALRWHERRGALWRESRAFLLLRRRRGVAQELRARRAAVEEEIDRLVERWRELQPPEAGPPGAAPSGSPAAGASRDSSVASSRS